MKKIKLNLLKKYNSILTLLITLLGFSSSCENGGPDSPVEYGTPSAKFIVNGKIVSEENSQAIPEIRVVMGNDTSYSDMDGNYQVVHYDFPMDQSFHLKFEDVDGVENGEFQPADSLVDFVDPEFTDGDGSWYSGQTGKTINIKLKPEK